MSALPICGLIPVLVVSVPPNSILLTRHHVVPLHTFSSHIVCWRRCIAHDVHRKHRVLDTLHLHSPLECASEGVGYTACWRAGNHCFIPMRNVSMAICHTFVFRDWWIGLHRGGVCLRVCAPNDCNLVWCLQKHHDVVAI